MQFTPYALPLILAGIISGALMIYSRRFRATPGAKPFMAAAFGAMIWTWAYALDLCSLTPAGIYASWDLRFSVIPILCIAWLETALELTERKAWLTGWRRRVVLIIPALTSLIVWTTPFHPLFRTLVRVDLNGPFPTAIFVNGPWYWVHVLFCYLIFVAALTALFLGLRGASPLQRRQIIIVILALSLTFVTDFLNNLGVAPIPGFNLAVLMNLPSALLVIWALFGYRLLAVRTIARSRVMEQMRDLMLVADEDGRLADINRAAANAFELDMAQAAGRPIAELLARWPDLLARALDGEPIHAEWSAEIAGNRKVYDLSVTLLENTAGERSSRLILLRDITERTEAEEALRASEARFRQMADYMPAPVLLNRMEDGVVLYLNRRAADAFGLTVEQGLGQPAPDYYANPADRARFVEELRRSGQIRDQETLMRRAQGEVFWASINATVIQLRGEKVLLVVLIDVSERKAASAERERLIGELQDALAHVKQLSGLLPICASCKKIRNDQGYWEQIEIFVRNHSEAEFSHGLCPECARKLYPGYFDEA